MTSSTATSPVRTIEDGAGSRLSWLGVERDPDRGDVLKVRNEVAPGHGPPMHTHFHQTEELTVLHGTIAWQLAGEDAEHRAGPGETVRFEPGVPHRFWNAGDEALICEGGIWPPDNIEYFLSNVYESTRRNGGKRPTMFDGAFLTTHFRTEFRMDEIPALATKVIIPLVVRVGRLLGRYKRFADAPTPVGAGTSPRPIREPVAVS